MSDYNFKNIPILDDIIESDDLDSTELKTEDDNTEGSKTSSQVSNEASDENLDFFANEDADTETSRLIDTTSSEDDMSEANIIDQAIIDDSAIEANAEIKIDFEADTSNMLDLVQAATDVQDNNVSTQASVVESTSIQTEDSSGALPQHNTPLAASLESIVEDVVKQLMPDLEQQLRYLVEQALGDKLPNEIISQLSNKAE